MSEKEKGEERGGRRERLRKRETEIGREKVKTAESSDIPPRDRTSYLNQVKAPLAFRFSLRT